MRSSCRPASSPSTTDRRQQRRRRRVVSPLPTRGTASSGASPPTPVLQLRWPVEINIMTDVLETQSSPGQRQAGRPGGLQDRRHPQHRRGDRGQPRQPGRHGRGALQPRPGKRRAAGGPRTSPYITRLTDAERAELQSRRPGRFANSRQAGRPRGGCDLKRTERHGQPHNRRP